MRLTNEEKYKIEDYWYTTLNIVLRRSEYDIIIYSSIKKVGVRGITLNDKKAGGSITIIDAYSLIALNNPNDCIMVLENLSSEDIKHHRRRIKEQAKK